MGLYRRQKHNLQDIVTAVKAELAGSGVCLGYRGLQQRLLTKYGLFAPRDTVSSIQRYLDPDGVNSRKRHRLRRRTYVNGGPNYLVHIDGYDKLKPYGFALHGAIDGFSRRVLWLRVGRSNNNPAVVATFFLEYLKEIKGAPRRIRFDAGTENTLIEDIQVALRWEHSDDMASHRSVIMGPSPSNQRIERYWRNCREGGGQFWMSLFKDLEAEGQIDVNDQRSVECLRFCFTRLIQDDLDHQMIDWNQHRIRPSSNCETVSGKPDMMFFVPELFDAIDYKTRISTNDLDKMLMEFCQPPNPNGCDVGFEQLCENTMHLHHKTMPQNHEEALDLYVWLSRMV